MAATVAAVTGGPAAVAATVAAMAGRPAAVTAAPAAVAATVAPVAGTVAAVTAMMPPRWRLAAGSQHGGQHDAVHALSPLVASGASGPPDSPDAAAIFRAFKQCAAL